MPVAPDMSGAVSPLDAVRRRAGYSLSLLTRTSPSSSNSIDSTLG